MAQSLVLEIKFGQKELDEEFSRTLKEATRSWRVGRSVDEKVEESVRKVAIQQAQNKLREEFRIIWTPGNPVVQLIVREPDTLEEVEDALNTANPHIFPTPTGAIVTEDGVTPEQGSVHWDDIETWIAETLKQYINTAVFLSLGAFRIMKDAG